MKPSRQRHHRQGRDHEHHLRPYPHRHPVRHHRRGGLLGHSLRAIRGSRPPGSNILLRTRKSAATKPHAMISSLDLMWPRWWGWRDRATVSPCAAGSRRPLSMAIPPEKQHSGAGRGCLLNYNFGRILSYADRGRPGGVCWPHRAKWQHHRQPGDRWRRAAMMARPLSAGLVAGRSATGACWCEILPYNRPLAGRFIPFRSVCRPRRLAWCGAGCPASGGLLHADLSAAACQRRGADHAELWPGDPADSAGIGWAGDRLRYWPTLRSLRLGVLLLILMACIPSGLNCILLKPYPKRWVDGKLV